MVDDNFKFEIEKALKAHLAVYGRGHLELAISNFLIYEKIDGFTREVSIINSNGDKEVINPRQYIENNINDAREAMIEIYNSLYRLKNGTKIVSNEYPSIASFLSQELEDDIQLANGTPKKINMVLPNIEVGGMVFALSGCDGFDHQQTVDRSFGELQLASNQGDRENQEDAGVICEHPLLQDFKLVALADGMGGLKNGEFASALCIGEIYKWFYSLPLVYYNSQYQGNLLSLLQEKINSINQEIQQNYPGAGTTFVCAITQDVGTLIANVRRFFSV